MVLWDECPTCKGRGKTYGEILVLSRSHDRLEPQTISHTCSTCGGRGRVARPLAPVDAIEEETSRA